MDYIFALIEEIRGLVADVNVNEIAAHFNGDDLLYWCGVWREEAQDRLGELEELIHERE